MKKNLLMIVVTCMSMGGCATHGVNPNVSEEAALSDSAIEISYVLGHDRRRFSAEARESAVKARTFLDRDLVREGAVDREKYAEFVQRVSNFVTQGLHRAPAAAVGGGACRAPYTVMLRLGKRSDVLNGCRNSEENGAGIGRLARDAEFLFYSRRD